MCIEAENIENTFNEENKIEDTDREEMARRYYRTRSEAEAKRQRGDRIYYKPGYGYYIVRPKKRDWWNIS